MKKHKSSPFAASRTLRVNNREYLVYSIRALEQQGICTIARLPFSIRILLENMLRYCDRGVALEEDVIRIASWHPEMKNPGSIPFMPGRVILQDFTGVPAIVDLAALRSAVARHGGNPELLNPLIPADLIVDHSVQVDSYASKDAYDNNHQWEMRRNHERYAMLHWGQQSFTNFRVVPPGNGIVHQVNLEYLASVVQCERKEKQILAYPDTLIGTDSHTTMINGLGVLGWGVGGIEAEAVLFGQPYSMQIPEVVGVKLTGSLPERCTATDLVLTITRFLREKGVVGRFVEFFGPGIQKLSLPDRATIANMAPEYGATMGFFPVDREAIRYLRASARTAQQVQLVENYCKEQDLFMAIETPDPEYTVVYTVDMGEVEPCLAGPRKPQENIPLAVMKDTFVSTFPERTNEMNVPDMAIDLDGRPVHIQDGSVVIAAITSCTNTSNPAVMIGAGLLAQKAAARGLRSKPWVKTSLAPGSRVVSQYLEASDLLTPLETLGFHVVAYGCTTCIGNSGPLHPAIAERIEEKKLNVAAVLSGNRNFEARIHPLVHVNYLCSPILVLAYALAGTVVIDFEKEPLAVDDYGIPVYLVDIWPTTGEIEAVMEQSINPELFTASYRDIFSGDDDWRKLEGASSSLFQWDKDSTYIREPPFFKELATEPSPLSDITGSRVLALFGDTITTDHISPAGAIPVNSPAGHYLQGLGIHPDAFNSYGSRRGNHQVMVRGTFANIRIRNKMVDREGGFTLFLPEEKEVTIYDAAMRYQESGTPLVIIAGRDYGIGSSRDWAAKGTVLLGVKAVIAVSFERIHRSNLVGMGVLPLQFAPGTDAESLDIDGSEQLTISGLAGDLAPGAEITVTVERVGRPAKDFQAIARLDSLMELEYYRHGGILQKVLRQMLSKL
ncbi:MAG: aconitate hydratase AcnA [Desulfocapsa sp.]|nr:aconitate hydratase AcnA [Desulfocapsa sp.]